MIRMQTSSSISALLQHPAHLFSLDFDVQMVPPFLLLLVASLCAKAAPRELSDPKIHMVVLFMAIFQGVLRLMYETHRTAIHNWGKTMVTTVHDGAQRFGRRKLVQDAKMRLGMTAKGKERME